MKIITVPHPTLRLKAQEITVVDKKLTSFIKNLEETLAKKENPRGVGLAAPQVDTKWRIFATQLNSDGDRDDQQPVLRSYINPRITDHSQNHTFGPDKKDPILEGCLSIPGFYGPVPRWEWVDLTYDYIDGNDLKTTSEHFEAFAARVVQHELDHLDGILFVDYIDQYKLPLYKEDSKTEKLEELEPDFISALVEKSR